MPQHTPHILASAHTTHPCLSTHHTSLPQHTPHIHASAHTTHPCLSTHHTSMPQHTPHIHAPAHTTHPCLSTHHTSMPQHTPHIHASVSNSWSSSLLMRVQRSGVMSGDTWDSRNINWSLSLLKSSEAEGEGSRETRSLSRVM